MAASARRGHDVVQCATTSAFLRCSMDAPASSAPASTSSCLPCPCLNRSRGHVSSPCHAGPQPETPLPMQHPTTTSLDNRRMPPHRDAAVPAPVGRALLQGRDDILTPPWPCLGPRRRAPSHLRVHISEGQQQQYPALSADACPRRHPVAARPPCQSHCTSSTTAPTSDHHHR
jgi:hypothetical protein